MLEKSLTEFGLTSNEAKVYLAALELGQSLASTLGKKTGINRSTVYMIIQSLKKKGLLGSFNKKGVDYFVAADPDALLQKEEFFLIKQQKKVEQISLLSKRLQSLRIQPFDPPKFSLFEGIDGMKMIYDDVLKSRDILAYASIKDIFTYFPENAVKFEKAVKSSNITLKEIVEDSPEARKYATNPFNDRHEVRCVSYGFPFTMDYLIYENKVALLNFVNNLIGIVIESKEIAASQRAIFALAWEGAIKCT